MIAVLLLILHTLAAAAWFGSMFYSLTVLQPRAKKYFQNDKDFEDFIATMAHGARYKVLAAIALIGITGLLLIPHRAHPPHWWPMMIGKIVILLIATVLFCYGSWVLWPRRIFAAEDDIVRYQRKFRRLGLTLLFLAGLAIVLGLLAH